MACYELLTGPFIGAVVQEGIRILDIPFADLDWETIMEDYENSWESKETDEPITLGPASEWDTWSD